MRDHYQEPEFASAEDAARRIARAWGTLATVALLVVLAGVALGVVLLIARTVAGF